MQIFFTEHIDGTTAALTGDEAGHCSRVLRKQVGDELFITDGIGSLYTGIISQISKKEVALEQLSMVEKQPARSGLTVAIAPTKSMDRFEWFLEKATEIGISEIIPIRTKRSERKVVKPERCEKIVMAAVKQSKNLHKPILRELTSFAEFLKMDLPEQKFIAHCMEPDRHLSHLYNAGSNGIVMIGPEGDFTPDELELAKTAGWQEVSLGASRLRTETAGIVATHIVSMLSQNI